MPPTLVLTLPNGTRSVFPLLPGTRRRIGSDSRCSIQLPPQSADPVHCEVFCASGLWQIRDLGSTLGTVVNELPIATAVLAVGDTIQVGQSRLRLVQSAGPGLSGGGGWRHAS